jgi:hypothetical protein
MKTYDIVSSLFWLFVSIVVCTESLRMGTGTLGKPGMGFIGFGAAALLGIFALILLVQALLRKEEGSSAGMFTGLLWRRVVLVLVTLLLYSWLMPILGYLVSTFLLMSSLFWVMREGHRWWWSPVNALAVTIATFLVFSVWLNCQYPQGLFGF